MANHFKVGIAAIGTIFNYMYGGWSALLIALVIFVALDYATGCMAAAVTTGLNSKVGRAGIARKAFIFVIVAAAHVVDGVIGEGSIIRDAVIWFYLANELISIVENGGRMGAPIPPAITQAIAVLKGKTGTEKDVI